MNEQEHVFLIVSLTSLQYNCIHDIIFKSRAYQVTMCEKIKKNISMKVQFHQCYFKVRNGFKTIPYRKIKVEITFDSGLSELFAFE